jgi:hypothetical protein
MRSPRWGGERTGKIAAAADGPAFTSTPTVMVYAMYLRQMDHCMRVVQPMVDGPTLYLLSSARSWICQTKRPTSRDKESRGRPRSLRELKGKETSTHNIKSQVEADGQEKV